jgi:hypothetical protein
MLRGSCLCGNVRYEVTGAVHDVHHCHCSMCRKSHGAAFSTFARLTTGDFHLVAGRETCKPIDRRRPSSELSAPPAVHGSPSVSTGCPTPCG